MKLSKENHKIQKNRRDYLITVICICIIYCTICLIKGIFPFGNARIDTSDFQDESVPAFYYLWDFLHGNGNFFFCWEAGSGLGMNGVASFLALINPFSLFFFFIKRSWIEPFMPFFILIKYAAMGCSMCFFLRNFREKQRPDSLWTVTGSVGYALSGYSVQYYLFSWLDIAALFPLLIYSLLQMARHESGWQLKKHSAAYLFLMAMIFIIHIPQAYMVCFYLILFAGSYFFFSKDKNFFDKNARRSGVLKFGLLTLLALALSAVIFVPAAILIMQSGRMSEADYSYFQLLAEPGMDPACKRIMLYSVIVPLVYLIVTLRKTSLKTHLCEYIVMGMMILPVFAESVNVLWHMGRYICFPMRFGYMMIFTVIAAAGNRMAERKEPAGHGTPAIADKSPQPSRNKKSEYGIAAFWFFLILIFGVWLIRAGRPGEDDNFIEDSEEVSRILPDDSDVFHKTKLADSSLSPNYPMITQTSAFSNYVHLISQESMDFNKALGYAQVSTNLSDTGGTLFSDALLGYTTTFKSTVPDTQGFERNAGNFGLYESIGETEHFAAFKNRYTYPAALTISKEAYDTYDTDSIQNPLVLQNALSELFFDEELFHITDHPVSMETDIDCEVLGKGIVYLYSSDLRDAVITVNGAKIPVPDFFYGLSSYTYPGFYNGGILSLGCYENETVTINISHQPWAENIQDSSVSIGILDFRKFAETTKREAPEYSYHILDNGLQFHTRSKGNEYLFLPCLMQNGFRCTINGTETPLSSLNGTFLLIPLTEGENEILLSYTAPGTKTGLVITVTAAVLFLLWAGFSRHMPQSQLAHKGYRTLVSAAFFVFGIVYGIYLIIVDVIPAVYTLYSLVK